MIGRVRDGEKLRHRLVAATAIPGQVGDGSYDSLVERRVDLSNLDLERAAELIAARRPAGCRGV